jgi:hypothetical protein
MEAPVTYYKVLNGLRPNVADTSYRYPGVGRWTKRITGDLVACERGYHLARDEQVLAWLGPIIYEAEPGDVIVEAGDKVVTDRVRLIRRLDTWNERSARLFAADCAERALNLAGNPDPRSVAAVDVARRFACGEATEEERAAAWAAAWAAAGDAAWDAAGAAAWAAAWAAAGDAAWAAARAAARAAAWAAAGDAAWAAAGAAARAAARAAAWDAAWDAARRWQYQRLVDYLEGRAT